MKIIVLGGAGEMGSRAAEYLVAAEGVTRVTLADRNRQGGEAVAARLKGKGATVDFKAIDAFDENALAAALAGYDVAAGALGPFYIFEERLVRAALAAGVDYCSICDEWEPAEAVLNGCHDQARDNGVTVITGLGASPGLTNVAVGDAMRQMDQVQRVRIALYLPLDCGAAGAALRHGLYIMCGRMILWREGRRTAVPACSEKLVIEFPRFGKLGMWNMGHSEPATIPRYFPEVRDVEFYMGFGTGMPLIAQMARWRWFDGPRRSEFFARAVEAFDRLLAGPEQGAGAIRADIWGERNGEPVHAVRCGTGTIREVTGLDLAIGAWMLGKKQLITKEAGVYAPEGSLDAAAHLKLLSREGIKVYADLEMTAPLY